MDSLYATINGSVSPVNLPPQSLPATAPEAVCWFCEAIEAWWDLGTGGGVGLRSGGFRRRFSDIYFGHPTSIHPHSHSHHRPVCSDVTMQLCNYPRTNALSRAIILSLRLVSGTVCCRTNIPTLKNSQHGTRGADMLEVTWQGSQASAAKSPLSHEGP
ncbi:hypothetical protein I7I53_09124 [Histoplasma capsulatum var. duboisii H88]|uniref:Uncharacterized protein n=1 Tax=Ajellomyces capsulatus (strain H88) TaxID=544711 RepID=A0A8A1L827_AJEC8|nr:hypothetical protein I7I53_09124 [Histoplasma capsulatum var. duboisii H88]